jgi:putative lipoic acid-binding regulatory protein
MSGDHGKGTGEGTPADNGDATSPVAERADTTSSAEAERGRALALLEATHQFPCDYSLTVIAFNAEPVTVALKAAVAEGGADHSHQAIESKAGKYLSHRFAVKVTGAAHVLELYARVRSVHGVVTVM